MPSHLEQSCTCATTKGERIAPGITRIRGNLCNVHGRYGPCDAALSGSGARATIDRNKRINAQAAQSGGSKGGRKPRAAAKPKKTEDQKRAEQEERKRQRDAEREAKRTEQDAERRAERDRILGEAGIDKNLQGALIDARDGNLLTPANGAKLAEQGLAEQGSDGTYRLSPKGTQLVNAADRGDAGEVARVQGEARDQVAAQRQRESERTRRQQERDAKRAEAERKRQERESQRRGGGGKRTEPKKDERPAPRRPAPRRSAGGGSRSPSSGSSAGNISRRAEARRRREERNQDAVRRTQARANRAAEQAERSRVTTPALANTARKLSEGGKVSESDADALVRNGLARRDRDGKLTLTSTGLRAVKQATTKAQTPEDRAMFAKMGGGGGSGGGGGGGGSKLWSKNPKTGKREPTNSQERQIKQDAGAALASPRTSPQRFSALIRGSRSGRGEGGFLSRHDIEVAGRSLVRDGSPAALRRAETIIRVFRGDIGRGTLGLPKKEEKSFAVFKDARGQWRWITRTTTAFEDRDGEVISIAALEKAVERMDARGNHGPLRWWHVGEPEPLNREAPWGKGADLGWCDFSAVHGRTLIESGTFINEEIALAVAAKADELELSPGFLHNRFTDPDPEKVYNDIDIFERSTVPTWAGRASNFFTGLTVEELSMDQKKKEAFDQLGVSPETAAAVLGSAETKEKDAEQAGIRYKETDPILAALKAFIGDTVREVITEQAAPAADEPPVVEEKAAPVEEEIVAEAPVVEEMAAEDELGMEEDAGGLTLSPEDITAIGEAVAAAIQASLAPLVGAMDMETKMRGHLDEIKGLFGNYTTTKDAEEVRIIARVNGIDQRLKELEGDQPAAKPTRASQSPDTAIRTDAELLAVVKAASNGAGPFDDIITNLGLGPQN